MKHLDLFSGIGGFAYAAQQVWGEEYENIGFVEIDRFCQEVLKKRFPGCRIWGDIRTITDTKSINGRNIAKDFANGREGGSRNVVNATDSIDLITGGFPCQPFSQAGKRKGTSDNRYLWPEMLRVIREFYPRWVIAENVLGIINIQSMEQQQGESGMESEALDVGESCGGSTVFIGIIEDLEQVGYEVQTFVIPACAVNAPHRRDRVWIVAKSEGERNGRCAGNQCGTGERFMEQEEQRWGEMGSEGQGCAGEWEQDWYSVALRTCVRGVDDGTAVELDGFKLSAARHRVERLKALGNAIVPQVAVEIMRAIKMAEQWG